MNQKPILFSGPMVNAILSGQKTMTRRVMNPQPPNDWCGTSEMAAMLDHSPYKVGMKLWVREKHCFVADGPLGIRSGIVYAADNQIAWRDTLPDGVTVYNAEKSDIWKWRPSIFMPKWASRISLRITDVRVERLQDISHHDILAEGVGDVYKAPELMFPMFAQLWDSINRDRGYGWEVNPYVWVISFERAQP